MKSDDVIALILLTFILGIWIPYVWTSMFVLGVAIVALLLIWPVVYYLADLKNRINNHRKE